MTSSTFFQRRVQDFGELDNLFEGTIVVGDDDYEADDDGYLLPQWTFMMLVVILAALIVALIFYMSYKHERTIMKQRRRSSNTTTSGGTSEGEIMVATDETRDVGKKESRMSVTKWGDDPEMQRVRASEALSTASTVCSGDSVISNGSSELEHQQTTEQAMGSVRSNAHHNNNSLAELWTQPRCVLCSKSYETGDNVTHSDNPKCHHDFHLECLRKHWGKKLNNEKCPVCKEDYMINAESKETADTMA